MRQITTEDVNRFLNGHDPMEHIISIECDYSESKVSVIYVNEKGEKRIKLEDFYPFLWAKRSAAIRLYEGNRALLRKALMSYHIGIKQLESIDNDSAEYDRLKNGYKYLFYAKKPMSYAVFQDFFTKGGVPTREKSKTDEPSNGNREYIAVTPVEQYMISSGRRLFKGYENYNDLLRLTFDLETSGLNPKIHRIEQIGMHTNRGFDKIISVEGSTKEELDRNELEAIDEMLKLLSILKPDIVCGHNSENFDWDFLIVRCQMLGVSFEELSLKYFRHKIYKKSKESVLKLGGEIEYYKPTIMWGHNIIDSLHAARRAQAIDSNMKSSNLKYVTKYLNLKKDNRVYVPGDRITSTWNDKTNKYAFSDANGDWYKITSEHPLKENYAEVSGKYIVERYLLDDLWETDKVEERLNESNFLVGKMLPTTFSRACTMGTAGIWKLIMLAWSYENDLVIPSFGENRKFTGGLSRLLKTGYVDRIVKLDYNSLYPSVILTWNIENEVDFSRVLNTMLNYVLGQREKYKELKAEAGEKADALKERLNEDELSKEETEEIKREIKFWKAEKSANDKKQLPLKILGNSYFGSAGSPSIWPWASLVAAEKTTCISRQLLRLMISHFKSIGYEPIVGDSFTADTPLFIKYNDSGLIDIKPICELIGNTETDELGREYDTSEKAFKVLCRGGWMSPSYIYRHKTNKPIYEVSEGSMSVSVTEDHSLFNDKQEKIKPSEIDKSTKLEYFNNVLEHTSVDVDERKIITMAKMLKNGTIDKVPTEVLNLNEKAKIELFLNTLEPFDSSKASKTCRAGINFLKKIQQKNGNQGIH